MIETTCPVCGGTTTRSVCGLFREFPWECMGNRCGVWSDVAEADRLQYLQRRIAKLHHCALDEHGNIKPHCRIPGRSYFSQAAASRRGRMWHKRYGLVDNSQ